MTKSAPALASDSQLDLSSSETFPADDQASRRRRVLLSWGAILGQVVFTAGWLLAGALEPAGYSSARHDSSDLASLTAHHAPLILTAQAIGGALTVAFAIGALRRSLAVRGRRSPIGAWLVAGSLAGCVSMRAGATSSRSRQASVWRRSVFP